MNRYNVLLSCSDPKLRQLMSMALGDRGCFVTCANTEYEAVEHIRHHHHDVVLVGIKEDAGQAMAVLSAAKQADPMTIVILAGCKAGQRYDVEHLPYQADELLMYPCDVGSVWKRVGHCLEELEMKKRDAHCIYARRRLVGIAQDMKQMADGHYGNIESQASVRLHGLLEEVYGLIGSMDAALEPAVAERFTHVG